MVPARGLYLSIASSYSFYLLAYIYSLRLWLVPLFLDCSLSLWSLLVLLAVLSLWSLPVASNSWHTPIT